MGKRRMAARLGNGRIGVIEGDIPPVSAGTVLVEVRRSLVSPGTELGGWRGLSRLRENPPDNAQPQPFGYSNAGVVRQTGSGVERFRPGDRVACIGAGYALHSDWVVVPRNLCTHLPENVSFAQGAFAMLAATSLHALRRGEPRLGEFAAVVGLGLVGQLAAQLYQLAGNYVIGWDTLPLRLRIASHCGVDETADVGREDVVRKTQAFTGGAGLDSAVIAYGGEADRTMEDILASMKLSPDTHRMGTIVIVGSPRFRYPCGTHNVDIRRAARTGPGYHDEPWEIGPDYPSVFMRWTTRTNLALCMRLISEGKLNVDPLITHTVPLQNAEAEIDKLMDGPDSILGLVFAMN